MSCMQGRVVMITGGASGIGLATAQALLRAGASVLLTGHEDAALRDAVTACGAPADRLVSACADVRDLPALQAAVGLALQSWGRLDGLVSAAGIQSPGTATTMGEADWNMVLDVNLSGAFRAAKAAIPAIEANGGAIVLVASVQAHLGKRNGVAYVAAKGALVAMARAMALDHAGAGIRVNSVSPGVVDTPLLRAAASRATGGAPTDAIVAEWANAQPLGPAAGRACTAEDVAQVILFLLGDGARYVTGSDYAIDGGLGAKLAF